MSKRIWLPLFVLTALMSIWYMYFSKNIDTEEKYYPLSNNPEEGITLVLLDKYLYIRNLPKTDKFNYVLLRLTNEQIEVPAKKSRNVQKKAYDVRFDLRDVSNGSYDVELYTAPEMSAAYHSYNHNQVLRIQIDDSAADFIEPLTLAKNKEALTKGTYTTITDYLNPSEKIQSDHPDIMELANSIIARSFTGYEKAKAIHDWVCENVWYDYDALYSGVYSDESALDTLKSRKGVCIGYASLTAALLRAVGIPTKLEAGYVLNASMNESWTDALIASNQSNHVWNEAYVDGRWIIIDTSYDSNNTYKNKTYSTGTGMKDRKFFDITLEFLSTDRYIVPDEFNPVKSR